jgi:restriction system protein
LGRSPGPAGGIDLIAHTDPLGTTGPRIKVQVKRRDTEKVSAESLRAFMAVLGDQDVGIYISAAGFSSQAEREARSQEKRRLKLIDLERFVELWVLHMHGLADSDRRRLPLKPVYFLDPALE